MFSLMSKVTILSVFYMIYILITFICFRPFNVEMLLKIFLVLSSFNLILFASYNFMCSMIINFHPKQIERINLKIDSLVLAENKRRTRTIWRNFLLSCSVSEYSFFKSKLWKTGKTIYKSNAISCLQVFQNAINFFLS